MKTSTRFSSGVHILTLLALHSGERLTSSYIAGSITTNEVVIRRLLGLLRKAGIVESTPGPSGGWTLKQEPGDISLSEIFIAVEPGLYLSYHHGTNPACIVGRNIQSTLIRIYRDTQKIVEVSLGKWSIQGVLASVLENEKKVLDAGRVTKGKSNSIEI